MSTLARVLSGAAPALSFEGRRCHSVTLAGTELQVREDDEHLSAEKPAQACRLCHTGGATPHLRSNCVACDSLGPGNPPPFTHGSLRVSMQVTSSSQRHKETWKCMVLIASLLGLGLTTLNLCRSVCDRQSMLRRTPVNPQPCKHAALAPLPAANETRRLLYGRSSRERC